MKTRISSTEGRFFPSGKDRITKLIKDLEMASRYPLEEFPVRHLFGAVLPHAGHVYSGHQTIPFFHLLNRMTSLPETFIIIHPNHHGSGPSVALDDAELWCTSLGEVPVDHRLGDLLDLPKSSRAHQGEHSAEVILPFLQYFLENHPFNILPVCMKDQSYQQAVLISEKIHHAIKQCGRNIMVLASCDFSHFLPPEEGLKKDQFVLDQIQARNAEEVEKAVRENQASICGYGPIMALMHYCGTMDSTYKIRLLGRGNSGEVQQSKEVVDYISMILYQ